MRAPLRRLTRARLLPAALLGAFLVGAFTHPLRAAPADSTLVSAAKDDDIESVRALIGKRADVNQTAADGSTPLLWAVYNGNAEMAGALLTAGARVDTPNHYGITPLLQASRTGDAALVKVLLRAGAKPGLAHPDGETPLMAAAVTGSVDAIRLLLGAGAHVDAIDTYQEQTALMRAAAEGHAPAVQALLAAGANPNLAARRTTLQERKHADHPTGGFTALMFAARNGHEEIVKSLADGGADVRATNGDRATPAIIAIVNDRFDLAAALLDLGSDPNDGSLYFAVDMHDATTDMHARDGSRLRADHPNRLTALDLIARLLDRGADPNKAFTGQLHSTSLCCGDEVNSSPFYRAAIAADVATLEMMLSHGAQVDWSPREITGAADADADAGRGMNVNVGKTPLMVAMVGGRGAPFAAGPGFGRLVPPPFREASNRSPLDAVRVLLAAGANPNAISPDKTSPLHQAVQARQVAMIRVLAAGGASLTAKNGDGLTPLQLAEKPEPGGVQPANSDPKAYRIARDSRDDVIATLRDLMKLEPGQATPSTPSR